MTNARRIHALTLVLLCPACVFDEGEGESTGITESAGEVGSSSESDAGEGPGATADDSGDDDQGPCEDEGAWGEGSDGDEWGDATAESTGGTDHPCANACQVIDQCDPESTECQAECEEEWHLSQPNPGCAMALEAFLGCLASLSCEEYIAYVEEETAAYPCAWEEEAYGLACEGTGSGCYGAAAGGNAEGTSCMLQFECASGDHEVTCSDSGGCTCFVDGTVTGTCDDFAGVCDVQIDFPTDAANTCCGWELSLD